KPTVHYTFRSVNTREISNVLVGEMSKAEAQYLTDAPDLDVLTCGPLQHTAYASLTSKDIKQFIEEATSVYDVVVFDTPPVLAVTDAQILANMVDGSILVVRSKHTEIEAATKAKEILEPARAKLLGTVLNGLEKKASNYYHY